jgi:hypothetical protein
MKSKITIEIDHDNQPIILITYEPSPDVRDVLIRRFLETFEGQSEYASFRFVEIPQSFIGSKARIRPIKPELMEDAAKIMLDIVSGKMGSEGAMNGSNL